MKKLLMLLALMSLVACSSNKKDDEKKLVEVKHEGIKKEFEVRDASSDTRPGWIEDAEVWAKQNEKGTDKYRFFSFETEPKVNRSVACDMAKANLRADIAAEITTFIDKTFSEAKEGNASIDMNNPKLSPLREYMATNLSEKVQSLIHGAAIVKTYWEQREYMKDRGAKEDFKAYTCAVLIRMDGKVLEKAINDAANFVAKKVEDPEMKSKVEKALENVSENFIKARKGEI